MLFGEDRSGLIVGRILEILPLPILIALVLGLALLFRQQACQRFAVVDWYRLRPASPTLKEKMS